MRVLNNLRKTFLSKSRFVKPLINRKRFSTIDSHIPPEKFHNTFKKLQTFFEDRGFLQVHTQNRLSILAACEDPETVSPFLYNGQTWPLPQTGQMWLEDILLKNPELPGVYCVSTSYRNEPNPIPGRHDLIFPMFEFEMHGGMNELINMESQLCSYLGFPHCGPLVWGTGRPVKWSGKPYTPDFYPKERYNDLCEFFGVDELTHEHEKQLLEVYDKMAFFITYFPQHTSPFWNMAVTDSGLSKKCDVILNGIETIGSAERSCDVKQMKENFYTISDGKYANLLFSQFGKDRVTKELNSFLSHNFFPRSGGGIGMTRLIKAMDALESYKVVKNLGYFDA